MALAISWDVDSRDRIFSLLDCWRCTRQWRSGSLRSGWVRITSAASPGMRAAPMHSSCVLPTKSQANLMRAQRLWFRIVGVGLAWWAWGWYGRDRDGIVIKL